MEGEREREKGREGGMEGGKEGWRREGGREGGREREIERESRLRIRLSPWETSARRMRDMGPHALDYLPKAVHPFKIECSRTIHKPVSHVHLRSTHWAFSASV